MKSTYFLAAVLFIGACASSKPELLESVDFDEIETIDSVRPASRFDASTISAIPAKEFDNGRMWTFEYPPFEYFSSTYGFEASDEWMEKARMSSVRIPGCSGSFVSPRGLVMTNHHCARESVSAVSKEGENLLDNGFVAATLSDERAIPEVWVDQLIELRDVTVQVVNGEFLDKTEEEKAARRESNIQALIAETLDELGGDDQKYEIQVISLFNGGRYSLYVYRRYRDVRLVMAPELQLGYFGGDPDNFTFPRYNLDMTFYRVYDEDGQPLNTTANHFKWSRTGAAADELVFLVGNPGSTTRQQTVSQLLYRGKIGDVLMHRLFSTLMASMQAYYDHDPVEAEKRDIRNEIFGLANTEKLYDGQIEALNNPEFLGRRKSNEDSFIAAIQADDSLNVTYLPLYDQLQDVQDQKAELAPLYVSWLAMYPGSPYVAVSLQRAFFGHLYDFYKSQGAPAENLEGLLKQVMELENLPEFYERQLIDDRITMVIENLGSMHPLVVDAFGASSPSEIASSILETSLFADADAFNQRITMGSFEGLENDPAFKIARVFLMEVLQNQGAFSELTESEDLIQTQLGQAWYAVYGTTRPPDATFSLRISDGVVKGYEYNGTTAPVNTTFYGMYDRAASHKGVFPWSLPARWQKPPVALDLATPLNFVSTNDIIGGNSGSPILNRNLEVVGLAFDSNIEGMGSNDFIFDTDRARCVSVDVRGMLAALRHVYKADALVKELMD